MDAFPIVSQVKSLWQWIGGDSEGAKQTQENFSRRCIVVSQVRSAVHALAGNQEEARAVQTEFIKGLSSFTDGIPIVGHLKGGIHYAVGDKEGGENAMKSASRTTGTILGGIAGGLVGGPAGAIAGGITGGAVVDGLTTGIDSAVHGEFRPSGYVGKVNQIIEKTEKD
jgi:hypothetical protein